MGEGCELPPSTSRKENMNFVDQFIMNTRYSREPRELNCSGCNEVWDVEGFVEFGRWNPDDEDHLSCPKCNTLGDVQ